MLLKERINFFYYNHQFTKSKEIVKLKVRAKSIYQTVRVRICNIDSRKQFPSQYQYENKTFERK